MLKRLKEDKNINYLDLNPDLLLKLHDDYFYQYHTNIEVTDMSDILEKLIKVAPTEGQARAAYDCYLRIRTVGYEQAKVSYTKPSWYRHIAILKASGLSRADLNASNVVPFRTRIIELSQSIRHWDDIAC